MIEIKVSAVGCSLADYLYTDIDFSGEAFRKYQSRVDGDGGLSPGRLVFADDLARFAGVDFQTIIGEITGGKPFTAFNLGGPAIVALINAAQLLHGVPVEFSFHGALGQDETADRILEIIRRTPVKIEHYRKIQGDSPFTDVLSDPDYANGKGERTFINNIGACWNYTPDMLDKSFFDADILFFGATALTPGIHDHLSSMLTRGKAAGGINVVTTVFDFRNEKNHPGRPWPLGETSDSFAMIDLLVMDWDEALKISGMSNLDDAFKFFIKQGVKSLVITHGAHDFHTWSGGELFGKQEITAYPVCALADQIMLENPASKGDTTGCGDNFAGGVLSSVAAQLAAGRKLGELSMIDACAWGAASGGFACFSIGGVYHEASPGDKRARLESFYQSYLKQVGQS